jgi:hypothetical protein
MKKDEGTRREFEHATSVKFTVFVVLYYVIKNETTDCAKPTVEHVVEPTHPLHRHLFQSTLGPPIAPQPRARFYTK